MTHISKMEFASLYAQLAKLFEQERTCQERIKHIRADHSVSPEIRIEQLHIVQNELVAASEQISPLREYIRVVELDPYELLALTPGRTLTRKEVEAAYVQQLDAVLATDRFWSSKADALRGNTQTSEDARNLLFAFRQLEYYEDLEVRLVRAKNQVFR